MRACVSASASFAAWSVTAFDCSFTSEATSDRLFATRWLTSASSTSARSRARARSAVRCFTRSSRLVLSWRTSSRAWRDLARVARHGDDHAATTSTITRPPTIETQRSIAALARCSLDARGQALVGGPDDAGRERRSPRPSTPCRDWCGTARARRRRARSLFSAMRLIHLGELLVDQVGQPAHHHARFRDRARAPRFRVSSCRRAMRLRRCRRARDRSRCR